MTFLASQRNGHFRYDFTSPNAKVIYRCPIGGCANSTHKAHRGQPVNPNGLAKKLKSHIAQEHPNIGEDVLIRIIRRSSRSYDVFIPRPTKRPRQTRSNRAWSQEESGEGPSNMTQDTQKTTTDDVEMQENPGSQNLAPDSQTAHTGNHPRHEELQADKDQVSDGPAERPSTRRMTSTDTVSLVLNDPSEESKEMQSISEDGMNLNEDSDIVEERLPPVPEAQTPDSEEEENLHSNDGSTTSKNVFGPERKEQDSKNVAEQEEHPTYKHQAGTDLRRIENRQDKTETKTNQREMRISEGDSSDNKAGESIGPQDDEQEKESIESLWVSGEDIQTPKAEAQDELIQETSSQQDNTEVDPRVESFAAANPELSRTSQTHLQWLETGPAGSISAEEQQDDGGEDDKMEFDGATSEISSTPLITRKIEGVPFLMKRSVLPPAKQNGYRRRIHDPHHVPDRGPTFKNKTDLC